MKRIENVEEPFVERVLRSAFTVVAEDQKKRSKKNTRGAPSLHGDHRSDESDIGKSDGDVSLLLVISEHAVEERSQYARDRHIGDYGRQCKKNDKNDLRAFFHLFAVPDT